MKIKVKHILLFIILQIFLVLILVCIVDNNTEIAKEKSTKFKTGSSISMMLETSYLSGEYKLSNSREWPKSGYLFNETLSKCENGGELTWIEETNSVRLKTSLSDQCYVYFDIEPPDVYVATSNIPTTYGKLGLINCQDTTAEYNQQYNRIEISQVNNKYTSCTLDYTDSTSKVNLATFITDLAGTTQGNGQVVSEDVNLPDYSTATTISESDYTNISMFSSSRSSSTSGTAVSGAYTFSNNEWTSVSSAMTSNTYYHFKFTPSENGYYQLCYTLSSGSTSNYLYAYVNSTNLFTLYASSSTAESGCIGLGYVSTSDYIMVTQRAYTTISTLTFSIKKVTYIAEPTDIRYEGKNPNNYLWFNNEYWRIIGVFDSNTHGQSGKNLVKIIADEVLDGLAWDKSNTNNWVTGSLNLLLNGAYYNAEDGTDSGYCYGYSTTATGNCDYAKKGIQDAYRSMITSVTWKLGGYSSNSVTAANMYSYERGTTVYSGRPTETTGYIGLMYPSDYGYSVLSTKCARTTNLSSYSSSSCAGESWLYGKGYLSTMMPVISSPNYVFTVKDDGSLDMNNAPHGYGVLPTLYLDSSVYVIDGDGTLDKPYIIGM